MTDRTDHDPLQVHHLGPVEDGELGGQPGARRQRLQVRERGLVEPVPVDRERAELEHPQAHPVAAVIALQPAIAGTRGPAPSTIDVIDTPTPPYWIG